MRHPSLVAGVVAIAALALTATPAAADSRVTARIDGPSAVQRGQEVAYTVTIRNAGSQTLGPGSPRVQVDLDALPSRSGPFGRPAFIGGAGAWSCRVATCTLASGSTLPPGATAAFSFPVKVLGSLTLDLDVRGNEVSFGELRKSVRTSGTQLPVVFGLQLPPAASPRTPPIGFTLSEPAAVTVRLERITARYRLVRRVRSSRGRVRRVASLRCADRRPRVRRTTRVRKLRSRCGLGLRTAYVLTRGVRGFNQADVSLLRMLRPGRRYRVRLIPRTRDGRQGREAYSFVFKATR